MKLKNIHWDKGEHEKEQIEHISSYYRINDELALAVVENVEYELYELFFIFYGKKTKKAKIGKYNTDEKARDGGRTYLDSLMSTLVGNDQDKKDKSEEGYIEYYSCCCSVYGKNPTYRELPAPIGCICGPKRRLKKSEREYKEAWIDGKLTTVLT